MSVTIGTKRQSIDLFDADVISRVVEDTIADGRATHVVVGVDWGASAFMSLEHDNSDDGDRREIEGNLQVH